jgi:hypothetical protein
MSKLFYDRFTGATASQPEGQQTIIGRWRIISPPGVNVFLNSVPVKSGNFLVRSIVFSIF